MDDFTWFCLDNKSKEFLKPYRSPETEASLFKNIPMAHLDQVKTMMQQLGVKARIVYRGPRGRYWDQCATWKEDANRFSVYVR